MMASGTLEHVNITVADADETSAMLERIFSWKVLWSGGSIHDGYTVHVGSDNDYLALYTPKSDATVGPESYSSIAAMNHIGVVVENLVETEKKVILEGLDTYNHANYKPGRRFYFRTSDNVEIEVVSYTL